MQLGNFAEHVFMDEDRQRRVIVNRQRQCIAGPTVDLHQLTIHPNSQDRVVGMIAEIGDHDVLELATE